MIIMSIYGTIEGDCNRKGFPQDYTHLKVTDNLGALHKEGL